MSTSDWDEAVERAEKFAYPPQLHSINDYKQLPGVVIVRDCWPERGHITLLIRHIYRRDLTKFISDNRLANITVHLEPVSGYAKFEDVVE